MTDEMDRASRAPARELSDEQIIEIRDSLLPSQGESFDTLAYARAVLAAAHSASRAPAQEAAIEEAHKLQSVAYLLGQRDARHAAAARVAAAPSAQAPTVTRKLEDIEQYRLQMAGISTASLGYWKDGDPLHPDYDTPALRDVARLYVKYDGLFKAAQAAEPVGLVDQRNGTTVAWQRGSLAAALPHGTGLYLAPQAPAAQPLTVDQTDDIASIHGEWVERDEEWHFSNASMLNFARAIERHHGIGIAPSAQGEPQP